MAYRFPIRGIWMYAITKQLCFEEEVQAFVHDELPILKNTDQNGPDRLLKSSSPQKSDSL